jgi:hypothetical protein
LFRDPGNKSGAAILEPKCPSSDAEAVPENCRALIKQINAELSAEEPFINVSSVAELLLYLESAASALKKSAPHPRKRDETKIALN